MVKEAAAALASGEAERALGLLAGIDAVAAAESNPALIRLVALFALDRHDEVLTHLKLFRPPLAPALFLIKGCVLEALNRREEAQRQFISATVAAAGTPPQNNAEPIDQLAAALAALVRPGGTSFADPIVGAAGRGLNRLSYFDFGHGPHRALALIAAQALIFSPFANVSDLLHASVFFGLFHSQDPDHQDRVFTEFLVPALKLAVQGGQFELALTTDLGIYDAYVKARETADHFRFVYSHLAPILAAGGRALAAQLPPFSPSPLREKYRVAFVVPNLVYLAHVTTLLDILECVRQLPHSRIEPVLFGFSQADPRVAERCSKLGIPIFTVGSRKNGDQVLLGRLVDLREHLRREGFAAAVWVSVTPLCSLAMGLRLAPAQIFLAMKYHSLSVPEIDGYLTGGALGQPTKVIEGREWRTAPTRFMNLFDETQSQIAQQIRSQIRPDSILIGTLGREEKLNNPDFIQSICKLLQEHRQAIFLWTGRIQLPDIQEQFNAAGVADRCIFVGWVNTLIYAQVVDVFLDSFPFPCGVTILQAMAAGKPAVFFSSDESAEAGIAMLIEPLLTGKAGSPELRRRAAELLQPQGKQLFLLAETPDQYVAYSSKLIRDATFRREVGDALRRFVNEFLTDGTACGSAFEGHIIDVIESKAIASGINS